MYIVYVYSRIYGEKPFIKDWHDASLVDDHIDGAIHTIAFINNEEYEVVKWAEDSEIMQGEEYHLTDVRFA